MEPLTGAYNDILASLDILNKQIQAAQGVTLRYKKDDWEEEDYARIL